MDDTQIASLIPRAGAAGAKPGWSCPDEAALAAYADGRLTGGARESLEGHISDCEFCCGQVGFLARAAELGPPPAVPAPLLAAARGERSWQAFGLRHLTALAATAGIVLAVVLASPTRDPGSLSTDPTSATIRSDDPALAAGARPVRRARSPSSTPSLLRPVEGETVSPAGFAVRWEEVAGALFYTVQLVDRKGDVAWEGRADGTRLVLPPGAPLAPGQRYFVWVLAHLRSGATARSDAVGFGVAPGSHQPSTSPASTVPPASVKGR